MNSTIALDLISKRNKYVSRGVGNITQVIAKTAKGATITDVKGKEYIDFASGIGMQNVGHCDFEIVEAIKKQADELIHPCYHVTMYEAYMDLAEKLVQITPGNYEKKVMFANSGAESLENAVKIARKYTGKTGILSLENAFHGRTLMTMTLTSKVKPYKNGFGPFAPDTYKIPSGYCYRCPLGAKYPDCGIACAEKIRTLLKGELSSDMIAAIVAEPIQGEGGFIVPPKEYLKALQEICNDMDILLVADEVQTGFARTGKMFASEYFGIEPDLMTLSKSIAAGLPISAVVGKAEIMDAPNPGEIGGTYGGSPLACVAALKVIEVIEKNSLIDKASKIGSIIRERLIAMYEKYEIIGDVRGEGAMLAIELVKDRNSKEPYKDVIKKIMDYALENGVIFISAGIFGNVIRFLPPLVMTEDQVNKGMDILDEAIGKSI